MSRRDKDSNARPRRCPNGCGNLIKIGEALEDVSCPCSEGYFNRFLDRAFTGDETRSGSVPTRKQYDYHLKRCRLKHEHQMYYHNHYPDECEQCDDHSLELPTGEVWNDYFIPSNDILYDVLDSRLETYFGKKAQAKAFKLDGKTGWVIRCRTENKPTEEDLDDLKEDTAKIHKAAKAKDQKYVDRKVAPTSFSGVSANSFDNIWSGWTSKDGREFRVAKVRGRVVLYQWDDKSYTDPSNRRITTQQAQELLAHAIGSQASDSSTEEASRLRRPSSPTQRPYDSGSRHSAPTTDATRPSMSSSMDGGRPSVQPYSLTTSAGRHAPYPRDSSENVYSTTPVQNNPIFPRPGQYPATQDAQRHQTTRDGSERLPPAAEEPRRQASERDTQDYGAGVDRRGSRHDENTNRRSHNDSETQRTSTIERGMAETSISNTTTTSSRRPPGRHESNPSDNRNPRRQNSEDTRNSRTELQSSERRSRTAMQDPTEPGPYTTSRDERHIPRYTTGEMRREERQTSGREERHAVGRHTTVGVGVGDGGKRKTDRDRDRKR